MNEPILTAKALLPELAPALRALLQVEGAMGTVTFRPGADEGEILLTGTDTEAILSQGQQAIEAFREENGRPPRTVGLRGLGAFFAEPPRRSGKRIENRIVLITGAAQGFGKEIALRLAEEGACTVIADRNEEGARETAEEICRRWGDGQALAVSADVGKEADVQRMIEATVAAFGGLDAFISNAGIVRAGSLDEMTAEDFELSVKINYTAYFLGAKYAQKVMKLQHRYLPTALFDIIQINSKSGLEGSNRNFAYAGSKAGGIGLTKSFALELCPYNIKVNAVCPGNFLDGPLWADPEKGLFLQYLKAGKIPGAKTVADVRRYYEEKVPMKRGCTAEDVVKAVLYCMEQSYETGQCIPVTGGQIMLS